MEKKRSRKFFFGYVVLKKDTVILSPRDAVRGTRLV